MGREALSDLNALFATPVGADLKSTVGCEPVGKSAQRNTVEKGFLGWIIHRSSRNVGAKS